MKTVVMIAQKGGLSMNSLLCSIRNGVCLVFMFAVCLLFTASFADAAAKQKTFSSPEAAVAAFVDALKTNNNKALDAILGRDGKRIVSSGDPVDDKNARARFVAAYEEKNQLNKESAGKAILLVGKNDFPWPIPLVKKGKTWYFDTKEGKEELINRRIGRNELNAIDILREYTAAQREYIRKDWDGDGVYQYALKLASTPGKRDGLYWEAKEGQEESPFGPLVAKAWSEGYQPGKGSPAPYHGYFFRILKAQGSNAKGGAYEYIANGKMVLGFAMIAYPAEYGTSGVMTFIVNQEGVIYEKDLGPDTGKLAGAMTAFDPDPQWKKVK